MDEIQRLIFEGLVQAKDRYVDAKKELEVSRVLLDSATEQARKDGVDAALIATVLDLATVLD